MGDKSLLFLLGIVFCISLSAASSQAAEESSSSNAKIFGLAPNAEPTASSGAPDSGSSMSGSSSGASMGSMMPYTGQAGSTNTTISPLSKILKNKEFKENTDITDTRLRADSGSLSRYSLNFSMMYNGPALGDLGAKDQADPDSKRSVAPKPTSFTGSMGFRYRLNSKSTVGLATGVSAIHPFHGMERVDVRDPQINYDYLKRIYGIQMRMSPGVSMITTPEYRKVGQSSSVYYAHNMVYDLGTSRFALGFDSMINYSFYDRVYHRKDGPASRDTVGVGPNIKYNFSDKFSMQTGVNISLWNPRREDDRYALLNRMVRQRMSVAYAFTRDIYVSPAISFYPQSLALADANFSVATIFSVF